jgi:sporulation protein YlmC with PRC-barrel domain
VRHAYAGAEHVCEATVDPDGHLHAGDQLSRCGNPHEVGHGRLQRGSHVLESPAVTQSTLLGAVWLVARQHDVAARLGQIHAAPTRSRGHSALKLAVEGRRVAALQRVVVRQAGQQVDRRHHFPFHKQREGCAGALDRLHRLTASLRCLPLHQVQREQGQRDGGHHDHEHQVGAQGHRPCQDGGRASEQGERGDERLHEAPQRNPSRKRVNAQRAWGLPGGSPATEGELDMPTSHTMPPTGGGARIQGHGLHDDGGPGPQLMTASTLTGDKVINRSGQTLGDIDEIMLDVPRGRIAYAVMASGGFLGMGEKLFAIPWNALTLDTDRHCFVLDVSKEHFENAPGFDKDHWPSAASEDWHREVHAYYRTPLYWE